jgi:tetratricopeptide (TPR) repeat protein
MGILQRDSFFKNGDCATHRGGRFTIRVKPTSWRRRKGKFMGFFKLFGGKPPEEAEKKADALFEAGEFGLAKMEYENGLEKWKKDAQGSEALEERIKKKLRKTREILARKRTQEGLEIMDSEYYEAAEESFRLALELTENPELIEELRGLLEEIGHRSGEKEAVPVFDPSALKEEGPERARPEPTDDEYFAALCSSLPEQVRREFYQYGMSFRQGYLALNEGNFQLAAEKLLQAMEENPGGSFIAIELATAYLNLERYQEARALTERYLRAHPDSPQGYHILCEVLWALQEFDKALELLDTCPNILAESLPVLLLRGETLLKAQRLEESERLYERELKSQGWHPDIALSLARIYEAQGKKEEARDMYGKLLAGFRACGSTGDTIVRQRFSDLSLELGEYSDKVLELYLSLVQEDPSRRADYYQKISRIYAAQGKDTEARRFEGLARQAQRELM